MRKDGPANGPWFSAQKSLSREADGSPGPDVGADERQRPVKRRNDLLCDVVQRVKAEAALRLYQDLWRDHQVHQPADGSQVDVGWSGPITTARGIGCSNNARTETAEELQVMRVETAAGSS